MLLWFLVRERERRRRTTDCDMLSCVCCCFYLQHLIYVHIIILHIQILSKSYAVYSICVRIISKYIYLKILILEVTSSGLFQTHNAIILLPIKPLLQRLAHLAPWEAESIQEIAEEFQYLWLHIQCAETMACVCVSMCKHTYIPWNANDPAMLIGFCTLFRRVTKSPKERTFTGSTLLFSLLWRHGKVQGKVQGGGLRDFWSFPHLKTGENPNSWSLSIYLLLE